MKTAVTFAALSFIILNFYPIQVFSQVVFTGHTIATMFWGAKSVYAADIDGDGDMDVLGAAYSVNDITWWENDGDQDFTEHIIAPDFDGANYVYAADIDGDNDMDVLGTAYWDDDITWWENDGEQNFTEHTIAPDFDRASSVYAADIDSDDDMDVLGAAHDANDITWWENDGEQDFAEHTIAPDFNGAHSVYAADIDGDGDMDILGAAASADDITWWENDREQDFTEHTIAPDFDGAYSVYAADIDGDDDMDVLGAACLADEIAWWENDGDEDFTEHTIAPDFDGAYSVYAADIDGDDDMDVLGAAHGADDITWWENDGEQDFTEHTIYPDFWGAISVYAADIDGDGDMDVLGAAQDYAVITWWENMGGTPPEEFELVSPEDEEVINYDTVTVRWTQSSDLDGHVYVVEWSTFEGFPLDSTIFDTTTDTFMVITDVLDLALAGNGLDELPDDSTIYWRVKAVDEGGACTWANDNEEGWSFAIYVYEPPDPFNLISPPDGFELINHSDFPFVFRWHSTTDPDPGDSLIYVFELSTDVEFSDNVYTVGAVDSVSLDSLEIDSYWWRVRVFDTYDLSTVSEVRSLSVTLPVGENYTTDIPTEFSIVSAYPNPFNPLLSVVIAIPERSELSVQIVNILGEEIASLAKGSYIPGYHKFAFDASNHSSGIYFIQASVPGKMNEVGKVVLVR